MIPSTDRRQEPIAYGHWCVFAAQSYIDYKGFSRAGLIDQLIYEEFTQAQAEYGANAVGLY